MIKVKKKKQLKKNSNDNVREHKSEIFYFTTRKSKNIVTMEYKSK